MKRETLIQMVADALGEDWDIAIECIEYARIRIIAGEDPETVLEEECSLECDAETYHCVRHFVAPKHWLKANGEFTIVSLPD